MKHIRFIYGAFVGIVKISDHMHENLRISSNALSRSINAQAEHWMRIGMLAELNPALDHKDICQLLIRVEQSGGFDLQRALALCTSPIASIGSAVSNTNYKIQEDIK